jgi:hypothetical protein
MEAGKSWVTGVGQRNQNIDETNRYFMTVLK